MENVFEFAFGSGNDAFEQIKADSGKFYPEYKEELEGIAKGANVSLQKVWAMNMLSELENLPDFKPKTCSRKGSKLLLSGHCTDVFRK